MQEKFGQVVDFIQKSGDRIRSEAGQIKDVGITKQYVTEEDFRIEREFKDLIASWNDGHSLFAEEENQKFSTDAEKLWILDPISGTKTFIEGLPHYGVVVSFMLKGEIIFSAVYDPSAKELFTAFKGKGSFLNGVRIFVSKNETSRSLILNVSSGWKDENSVSSLRGRLGGFLVDQNRNSFAVNYCHVACGRADGFISFAKDVFPEYAGSLIVREAGGVFTNQNNQSNFNPEDRQFVGGNQAVHSFLLKLL